jgi:hypothetical protein
MKRSTFFTYILPVLLVLFFMSVTFNNYGAPTGKQQYFEIKIYRVADKAHEATVDAYLKDAFLPALHRAGIPVVGVFKPIEADTAFGKMVYVFIPFKTIDQFMQLSDKLDKDLVYTKAGKEFLDAPYDNPPFVRYESILLKAFSLMPEFKIPSYTTPASERIYELRSYESATEAKATKKIHMFNEGGEMKIFESVGSNAVFYGQVLVGSKMPRLMYMTTYSDMKSHDDHWKAFGGSDGWKKLSGMDEYKNTVSKANPYLMHPTSYSDF